jgi:hypothetical protein
MCSLCVHSKIARAPSHLSSCDAVKFLFRTSTRREDLEETLVGFFAIMEGILHSAKVSSLYYDIFHQFFISIFYVFHIILQEVAHSALQRAPS